MLELWIGQLGISPVHKAAAERRPCSHILTMCPEYGCVCTSEASAKFPVGVAMHIHAVECFKAEFENSSLLYAGEKG